MVLWLTRDEPRGNSLVLPQAGDDRPDSRKFGESAPPDRPSRRAHTAAALSPISRVTSRGTSRCGMWPTPEKTWTATMPGTPRL